MSVRTYNGVCIVLAAVASIGHVYCGYVIPVQALEERGERLGSNYYTVKNARPLINDVKADFLQQVVLEALGLHHVPKGNLRVVDSVTRSPSCPN